jgi:hypothetical protein
MQVHGGRKGVLLLIHSLGTRWGQLVNARSRTLSPTSPPNTKEDSVPIVVEAGGRGGVLRDSLKGYGVRSPDNPARGDSLYLLRYLGNRPME